MKPIRIAVLTEEAGYGQALARGLAEQGKYFIVEVMDPAACTSAGPQNTNRPAEGQNAIRLAEAQNGPQTEWGVLVTDFGEENLPEGILESYRVVWLDEIPVRVSELIREILHTAGVSDGTQRKAAPRQTRVTGFGSTFGGSGVTSVALTAGRMLAGAYGERVLYLPFTEADGSRMYRSRERQGQTGQNRQSRELLYRMNHKLPYTVEAWAEADDYGLEYINGLECLNRVEKRQLLNHLLESAVYDQILLDLGNGGADAEVCTVYVDVCSGTDARYGVGNCFTGDIPAVRIRNHAAGSMEYGAAADRETPEGAERDLFILHDEESFLLRPETGSIEIVMSKSFAIGVKNLTEILLEKGVESCRTEAKPAGFC